MKLQVMAAYDSKARAFLQPFYCAHIDVGLRSFAQAANNQAHPIGMNPEDFTIWHLGTFDDENAVFDLKQPYANLGMARQFIKGSEHVQHAQAL